MQISNSGPNTPRGKATVARNALAHGLRSALPVLPGVEHENDWKRHRAGVLRALSPSGDLEVLLADRVAVTFWRLRRVVRYETAMAAADPAANDPYLGSAGQFPDPDADSLADPSESAGASPLRNIQESLDVDRRDAERLRRFRALPDDASLPDADACGLLILVNLYASRLPLDSFTVPGIPAGQRITSHTPWTAALARRVIQTIGFQVGRDPEDLLELAIERTERRIADHVSSLALHRQAAARAQRTRLLPPPEAVERVIRYEAHLSRQLYAALHELEACQSRRTGRPAPLARLELSGIPES